MKKTLIVAVVLAVLTVLLTQASVQYWVHTALAEIEDRHQADFAIDVSWVSAGFDGTLHLHDVAFTPYALKRTFHAEQFIKTHLNSFLGNSRYRFST